MIFNEYDMPLFSYFDQHYGMGIDPAWTNEPAYYFGKGNIEDKETFIPDYCYDV